MSVQIQIKDRNALFVTVAAHPSDPPLTRIEVHTLSGYLYAALTPDEVRQVISALRAQLPTAEVRHG